MTFESSLFFIIIIRIKRFETLIFYHEYAKNMKPKEKENENDKIFIR